MVVFEDDAPNGGVVVETLYLGDAFAAARSRGGFVVTADGELLEDRKRRGQGA